MIVLRKLCLIVILLVNLAMTVKGQNPEGLPMNPDWKKPQAPFRIVGNVYYVGTYDIACYLITTKRGHILINTGLKETVPMIIQNVEALGFEFRDIKIILANHTHYDAMGGMSIVRKFTKAKLLIDSVDCPTMADGGRSDYIFGSTTGGFEPVKPDKQLVDQDVVRLGRMRLTVLHHPGYSKGSCSYLFNVKTKGHKYRVLIANMPKVLDQVNITKVQRVYPDIVKDYGYTFKAMRQLQFDIWLAGYASQFNLHDKYKSTKPYDPEAFIDRAGYDAQLNALQEEFNKKLNMQ